MLCLVTGARGRKSHARAGRRPAFPGGPVAITPPFSPGTRAPRGGMAGRGRTRPAQHASGGRSAHLLLSKPPPKLPPS